MSRPVPHPVGNIAARKSYSIRKGRAYKTRAINGVPFTTILG